MGSRCKAHDAHHVKDGNQPHPGQSIGISIYLLHLCPEPLGLPGQQYRNGMLDSLNVSVTSTRPPLFNFRGSTYCQDQLINTTNKGEVDKQQKVLNQYTCLFLPYPLLTTCLQTRCNSVGSSRVCPGSAAAAWLCSIGHSHLMRSWSTARSYRHSF